LGSAHYALQDYRTPLRASMVSIVVSTVVSISLAVPMRSLPIAAAGIALGSALGSYVNLVILSRGLRQRLGPLYSPAMWHGTRRILLASLTAGALAAVLRLAQQHWFPAMHPRVSAVPVLAGFGITYLVAAWLMGSAEAARWMRRPARAVGT
jgi:putative peptidoglycan lipid II flippase